MSAGARLRAGEDTIAAVGVPGCFWLAAELAAELATELRAVRALPGLTALLATGPENMKFINISFQRLYVCVQS
jgi:hypothetical protein